jgi:predicted nucleic acid-binding Zn ribbon protein
MSENEKKRRKTSSHLSHVGDVLQSLLQSSKSPLSEQFTRWRLWHKWDEVVGSEIAKNSMPVSYLNGTLYVWVNSAPRMQEMTFLVREIRQKINQFAGKAWITSIRFTLDRKTVPTVQDSEAGVGEFLNKPASRDGKVE